MPGPNGDKQNIFNEVYVMRKIIILTFVFLLTGAVFAGKLDVKGQISEDLQNLQKDSETYRIKNAYVNLMARKQAQGKEIVTQKLIEKFRLL